MMPNLTAVSQSVPLNFDNGELLVQPRSRLSFSVVIMDMFSLSIPAMSCTLLCEFYSVDTTEQT